MIGWDMILLLIGLAVSEWLAYFYNTSLFSRRGTGRKIGFRA